MTITESVLSLHRFCSPLGGAALVLLCLATAGRAQGPEEKKPPAAGGDAPKAVRFETADKVMIAADYYAAEVKKGAKAPVAILVHMYPADRSSWRPLAPELRKAGFAVVAYDIRGHGGSTEPADKKLKEAYDKRDPKLFADAWKDVEAAKKWLEQQPGCDAARVALVGASIGCSISIEYAGRDEAVKAVVCLSPGTKYMGVDSVAHIKKCAKTPILLISPEGEYAAVEELIKASGDKAKGEKHPGGEERHGTKMFDAPYGKEVIAHIVEFVKKGLEVGKAKTEKTPKSDPKLEMARVCVGPIGPMSQAANMFKFNTGSYPESLRDLVEKPKNETLAKNWKGPYLESAEGLKDPWGHEYRYAAGEAARHNQGKFDLWSVGPDGEDGTADDIRNW